MAATFHTAYGDSELVNLMAQLGQRIRSMSVSATSRTVSGSADQVALTES